MRGRVVSITEATVGSELSAAVAIGAETLVVEDAFEFNWETGGDLLLGVETIAYTVDPDDETVLLDAPLAAAYDAGEPVLLSPLTIDRWASVLAEDQEEELVARVPHSLYDRLALGIRDGGEGEAVEVEFDDSGDLVVEDVLGVEPIVDGTFIDTGTLPPGAELTDGEVPASSPTPTVLGGPGYLAVKWTAVANTDPVTYLIYVSETTGFTPDPSELVGQTLGTLAFIREMPNGDPLEYDTTYFVKLVATDPDGSAAASTQGSSQLVQVDSPDLALNSVLAEHIIAGAIDAMTITGALVRSAASGARFEAGASPDDNRIGFRLFDPAGAETVTFDAESGQATVTGLFKFGSGSQLMGDDVILLKEQSTTGFQTPTLVQSSGASQSNGTTCTPTLPAPSSADNVLIAAVFTADNTRTHTTPAGWTLVDSRAQGTARLSVYRRDGGTTDTLAATFSGNDAAIAQIFEYSGVATSTAHDGTPGQNSNASASGTVNAGTTGATTQTHDLTVAFFGTDPWRVTPVAPAIERRSTSSAAVINLEMLEELPTSTGTQQVQATMDGTGLFIGITANFKAKAAADSDPDAPGGNRLKVYVKPIGSLTWPTTRRASGAVRHIVQAIPNAAPTAPIIARGVEVITVGAAAQGLSGAISHGLGHTPEAVHATVDTSLGVVSTRIYAGVESLGTTTFKIRVRTNNDSNISGDVHVYWTAIG